MHRGPDLNGSRPDRHRPAQTNPWGAGGGRFKWLDGAHWSAATETKGVWGDPGRQIKSGSMVCGRLLPPAMGNRGETLGRIWEAGLLT
jgi:hypothetical protein